MASLARGLQPVVVFFYVLALLRVAKRGFLAQKDPLDILLAILLASMIARAINGSAPFATSLASGLVLVLLHRALTRACWASPAVERLVKGRVEGTNDPASLACARLERNGRVGVEKKSAR